MRMDEDGRGWTRADEGGRGWTRADEDGRRLLLLSSSTSDVPPVHESELSEQWNPPFSLNELTPAP